MAVGPVQLLVLRFDNPGFHGEISRELERLRASDTVRVIDALAVHKDADGAIEVQHLSNLTREEAIELGSKVAALVGLGIGGEEGMHAAAEIGAEQAASHGIEVFDDGRVGRDRGDPERLGRSPDPARAPLGGAAAGRDRPRGRLRRRGRDDQRVRPARVGLASAAEAKELQAHARRAG